MFTRTLLPGPEKQPWLRVKFRFTRRISTLKYKCPYNWILWILCPFFLFLIHFFKSINYLLFCLFFKLWIYAFSFFLFGLYFWFIFKIIFCFVCFIFNSFIYLFFKGCVENKDVSKTCFTDCCPFFFLLLLLCCLLLCLLLFLLHSFNSYSCSHLFLFIDSYPSSCFIVIFVRIEKNTFFFL